MTTGQCRVVRSRTATTGLGRNAHFCHVRQHMGYRRECQQNVQVFSAWLWHWNLGNGTCGTPRCRPKAGANRSAVSRWRSGTFETIERFLRRRQAEMSGQPSQEWAPPAREGGFWNGSVDTIVLLRNSPTHLRRKPKTRPSSMTPSSRPPRLSRQRIRDNGYSRRRAVGSSLPRRDASGPARDRSFGGRPPNSPAHSRSLRIAPEVALDSVRAWQRCVTARGDRHRSLCIIERRGRRRACRFVRAAIAGAGGTRAMRKKVSLACWL
jgi:hypothetical protein